MSKDVPAKELVNYFFYKCGEANCWLPLAEDGYGLYVGFGDSEHKPKATWIGTRKPDAFFQAVTGSDDDNIAWLTHPRNRAWFLVVTFSQSELIFWQVRGKLQVHRPGSGVFGRAAKMWACFPAKARSPYEEIFGTGAKSPVFKTLPVVKVATVPRRDLYASVDSLAVYQYLNRGTCRSIWRITGPTEAEMPDQIAGQSQASVRDRLKQGEETKYAAFVRLYLNAALHRTLDSQLPSRLAKQPTLHSYWASMSALERQKLILATLNPILVETAALYFCLDLGLIGDIGSGKGIDVIDIRARAESQSAADTAADRLVALKSCGIGISEAILDRLRAKHVLELQCKAADRKVTTPNVIYFGYRQKVKCDINTVPIGQLAETLSKGTWKRGLLKRFLDVQERLISSTAQE